MIDVKDDYSTKLEIANLNKSFKSVKRVKTHRFLHKNLSGSASTTELHELECTRGITWEEAILQYTGLAGFNEGFYFNCRQTESGNKSVILLVADNDKSQGNKLYRIVRSVKFFYIKFA